jgi:hypothetical protein
MQGGGVGNRISQIWAGIGYAQRTGREFVFFEQHMTHNTHTPIAATNKFLIALFPNVRVFRGSVRWTRLAEEEGLELPLEPTGHILLDGYFQAEIYYPTGLKGSFTIPKPPVQRWSCDVDAHTYFVHFRFGDYVATDFNVDLNAYYTMAIASIQSTDPEAKFLLFSDEPTKIPASITGMERAIVAPFNIGIWETLWQMGRCHGGICANSSFSWTAAWAVKGPVYMPRVWKNVKDHVKVLPAWAQIGRASCRERV